MISKWLVLEDLEALAKQFRYQTRAKKIFNYLIILKEYLGAMLRYRAEENLRISGNPCKSCTHQPVLYIESIKVVDLR